MDKRLDKKIEQVLMKDGNEMHYQKQSDGRNVFFKKAMFMNQWSFYLILATLLLVVFMDIYIGQLITDTGNRIISALRVIYCSEHPTQGCLQIFDLPMQTNGTSQP
jgi:hypothetical protein